MINYLFNNKLIKWPEMPLRENEKKKIDYKAQLEKKLWLARENPEPIFDLSECNLTAVPNNIYKLCQVFRKDALYLQNNKLSSLDGGGNLEDLILLTLLDISCNNFVKLPSNIHVLTNLKVLDISHNKITELPKNIGGLQHLFQLNASNNRLKTLPMSIGECVNLEYLNLQENGELKTLPKSLGRLHNLNQLLIDSSIIYPFPEICENGIQAILKFLAEECGEDYEYQGNSNQCGTSKSNYLQKDEYDLLQEKCRFIEKIKDEKQKELLAIEEQLMDLNRREVEMQQVLKDKKKELITVVKNQQQSLDEDIMKVQVNKENQRALLIKECNNAEEMANLKIKKILLYNNTLREGMQKKSEREKKEEEDLLLNLLQQKHDAKPIEKRKLLDSMNLLLQEEIKKAQAQSTDKRVKVMQSLISQDEKRFEELRARFDRFNKDQRELTDVISRNEELQRSAVSSLLEKSDARLWQIQNQVATIEAQLGVLTQLELTKRRLETDTHLAELKESRLALTELLMELFRQQAVRRTQLVEFLRRIEDAKQGNLETFWLEQYQKLLNSKSQQLVEHLKNVDPDLANEFFLFGVFQYLHLFGNEGTTTVSDLEKLDTANLIKLGVTSEDDQAKVLKAIRNYISSRKIQPSAPPDIVASAPAMSLHDLDEYQKFVEVNSECVICMDSKADVIFVPCGHTSCCENCSATITICPLCRTPIKHILLAPPRSSINGSRH